IAQHKVGFVFANRSDGFVRVGSFGDHVEVVAEISANAGSPDRMVVGNDDSDGTQRTHKRTSVPRPARLSISTRPSTSCTRARIDRSMPSPGEVAFTSKPEPLSRTLQNSSPSTSVGSTNTTMR